MMKFLIFPLFQLQIIFSLIICTNDLLILFRITNIRASWIYQKFKMLIYFSFKSFVVFHNDFKLRIFVYNLQRFHVGEIEKSELKIKSSSSLEQIKDRNVCHFLMEH